MSKKKTNQVESPSIWSRVPKTGSDPPIGSNRDSGRDSSGVQFQGNWLKGKLLWLFPCFSTTTLLSYQGTDLFFFCPRPKINT